MSVEKLILSSGQEQILMSITPDWPSITVTGAIGLGSILTSIAVVIISRRNQKSQCKEKIAELRQAWLTELRNNMSKFLSLVSILSVRKKIITDYNTTEEAKELYQDLFFHRAKLRLMLDENNGYTIKIKSLMADLYTAIHNSESNNGKDIGNLAKELEKECQLVLEKTWKDIRKDLAV